METHQACTSVQTQGHKKPAGTPYLVITYTQSESAEGSSDAASARFLRGPIDLFVTAL